MRFKNTYTWISILALVCVFFLYTYPQSYMYFVSHPIKNHESKISITASDSKKHDFDVFLADTPALQQKGLGGRASLDDNQAMLFAFQDNEEHFFWMKDMLFSIDMVWLDEYKKVIHIEKRVAPETYPSSFGPNAPSRYVLEFDAGVTENINLKIGDSVSF
jgi:uncharacterized protein